MRKTLMATVSAAALSFVLAAGAQAQAVSVGLKGGLNSSTLKGADVADVGQTVSARQGFGGGGFMEVRVHRYFAVQPEVLYMRKGADIAETGFNGHIKLDYIEIPLLAKVLIPTTTQVTPYLFAGPTLAFKSDCKFGGTEGSVSVDVKCDDPQFGVNLKSTDFSGAFGGGFNFSAGGAVISLDARYTMGFTKIVDEATANDVKNRTFSAMLGVSMPLNAKTFALRTH